MKDVNYFLKASLFLGLLALKNVAKTFFKWQSTFSQSVINLGGKVMGLSNTLNLYL
jgi:hypothetical protein